MGPINPHPMWESIGELKVPAKVKIFLWRVMQNTIPCRSVLANRHIKVSDQCPVCENGAQDVKHLLFECSRAKLVWRNLGMDNKACKIDRAGQAVLEFLLSPEHLVPSLVLGEETTAEKIAITCWYLWWERRQFVHGEKVQESIRSAMPIKSLTANYMAAYSAKPKRKHAVWLKPPHDHVKTNMNASFDEDSLRGTTGAIARDAAGWFIGANNCKLDFVQDALTAEAHTMKHGIQLAQMLGCNRIVMSSDCLDVIETMNNGAYSPHGIAAAIFDDCYHLAT